jgi:hypothetical protein
LLLLEQAASTIVAHASAAVTLSGVVRLVTRPPGIRAR